MPSSLASFEFTFNASCDARRAFLALSHILNNATPADATATASAV